MDSEYIKDEPRVTPDTVMNEENSAKEESHAVSNERDKALQDSQRMSKASEELMAESEQHVLWEEMDGVEIEPDPVGSSRSGDDYPGTNGHAKLRADQDDRGIPVDRGWAWMVLLGTFIGYFIFSIYNFVLWVLLLDLVDEFQTTVTMVTSVMSAMTLTYCLSTQVVVNAVMPRVPHRKMMVTAALVNSLATSLFVALPSLPCFFVSSVIKATSWGGFLVPSMCLVGHYFQRRQALALSVCTLGISVCAMVVPPLTRFLKEEYGLRGGLLVINGLEMNAVVATMLLRPISFYTRERRRSSSSRDPGPTGGPPSHAWTQESHSKPETGRDHLTVSTSHKDIRALDFKVTSSSMESEVNGNSEAGYNKTEYIEMRAMKQSSQCMSHDCITQEGQSERERFLHSSDNNIQSHVGDTNSSKDQVKNPSLDLPVMSSVEDRNLKHSNQPQGLKASQNRRNAQSSLRGHCNIWKKSKIVLASILDVSLLKNYIVIMLLVGPTLNRSFMFISVYLPSHAVSQGVSESNAALLLTISGFVDVFTKVGYGAITDTGYVRPGTIIAATALYMGVLCQFISFYNSFGALVFFTVSYGAFGFTIVSLNSALIVDLLGVDKLGKVFALSVVISATATSIQHPIHGALIEATGSFMPSFHYVGTCYLLAGLCLLGEPLVTRWQRQKEDRLAGQCQTTEDSELEA